MSLPPPPWARPAREPSARPPLTRDAIVEAAATVLARDGYEAFSMRRVAQELGAGAASLYAHIANKDELLELILDRAAADLRIPDPDPARWQEQLKQAARDVRRMLSQPGLAQISLARIPTGPHSLVAAERIMAIARAGGLSDRVIAYLVDLLSLFVGSVAYEETLWIAKYGPGDEQAMLERLGQIRDYFASLPPERFPNMVTLASFMVQPDEHDERFEFALDVLIGGLAAYDAPHTERSDDGATDRPAE